MFKIYLLTASLLILILGVVAFRLSQKSPIKTTTPSPYQSFFSPTPQPSNASASGQAYSTSALQKDFQRLSNPGSLSENDAKTRQDLISSLGNKSGTITQTSDFRIDYDLIPNQFMIEIKINDADKAKKEAENFLTQKGLSTQGICNLPVVIYLEFSIKQYYKTNNLQFNPIPDGC